MGTYQSSLWRQTPVSAVCGDHDGARTTLSISLVYSLPLFFSSLWASSYGTVLSTLNNSSSSEGVTVEQHIQCMHVFMCACLRMYVCTYVYMHVPGVCMQVCIFASKFRSRIHTTAVYLTDFTFLFCFNLLSRPPLLSCPDFHLNKRPLRLLCKINSPLPNPSTSPWRQGTPGRPRGPRQSCWHL